MFIYFDDFLLRGGFHQRRCDAFLNSEDNSFGRTDTDCGGAKFNGFDSIFYLRDQQNIILDFWQNNIFKGKYHHLDFTWNSRPSGENVLTPRSYSERVRNILKPINSNTTENERYFSLLVSREINLLQMISVPFLITIKLYKKKMMNK